MDKLSLIVGLIGFVVVVLGLKKSVIDLKVARMKEEEMLKPIDLAKAAKTRVLQELERLPTIKEVRQRIQRQWSNVLVCAMMVVFCFLLGPLMTFHPDVKGVWEDVFFYAGFAAMIPFFFFGFKFIQFAAKAHEDLGALKLIGAIELGSEGPSTEPAAPLPPDQ